MKKVEKILGWIILFSEVCAFGLFFATKRSFTVSFKSIWNLVRYCFNIIGNLSNVKYLLIFFVFLLAVGFTVYLYLKNKKEKKVSILAPFAIIATLFAFFLAYRYRYLLSGESRSYRLFEVCLLYGFDILQLYSFLISSIILFGKKEEPEEEVNILTKFERVIGFVILGFELLAIIICLIAKGGIGASFTTIGNIIAYLGSVLSELSNDKYLVIFIGALVALIIAIVLFVLNIKKKKTFIASATSIPAALFVLCVAYRYRHFLTFDYGRKKAFAVMALLVLFGLLSLYALVIAIHIIFGKKKENVEEFYDEVIKEVVEEKANEETEEVIEPVEEVKEEVVEEVVEEVKEEPVVEEEPALELKETIALAKQEEVALNINKAVIYDYLANKYNDVELNSRKNETATGLPLADTHYRVLEDKKVCFVYVYEVDGKSFMLLRLSDKDYAKKVCKKYDIKKSAFPKQKVAWYSVIISSKFASNEEVFALIDEAYNEVNPAGLTLKESIELAKKTKSQMTKKLIIDHLTPYKENVELNNRKNFIKTGLPLADTHYRVLDKDNKVCFTYIYELDGSLLMLVRLPDEKYAKTLVKKYGAQKSAFPKQKVAWYSIPVSDKFESDDEVYAIIDEAYNEVSPNDGLTLKESIEIVKKTKSQMTKKLIIEHLSSYNEEVELNNRKNFIKTGLPLADTHYRVLDKDNKVCFTYIYELDGSLLMLVRVPDNEYAKTLVKKYGAQKSAFPKQKVAWYSIPVSDKFESDDEVYAVIDEAFKESK